MARKRKPVDTAHADELLKSGKTLKEVASLFGVYPNNLSKELRAVGLKTDYRIGAIRPMLDIDMAPIVAAYEAGESLLSISKRTGVARVALTPRLQRLGVHIRTGTEANYLRMGRMSAEDRATLTDAAHSAVRGVRLSLEYLERRALSRGRLTGFGEREIIGALRAAGKDPEGQRPCGKYNIDIAFARVAVEVCGFKADRPRDVAYLQRCKHLADAGYLVVLVTFMRKEALIGNLEDVIRELKLADGDPSAPREHRVIRCSSNRFTRIRTELGQFAVVPAPERFYYTVSKLDL